jgi:hypothetical protein
VFFDEASLNILVTVFNSTGYVPELWTVTDFTEIYKYYAVVIFHNVN